MEQKSIGLFVNRKKDKELEITKKLVDSILKYGMKPLLPRPISQDLGFSGGYTEEDMMDKSSFLISLGGDGTLLNMARTSFNYDVPVLGINLGTVGFLADVEINDIEKAIKRLACGEYSIEDRMVLLASVFRDDYTVFKSIAINDVVVNRDGLSRIIRIQVFVDDQFIDSFPGDGVIVSTPSGSTAYNLSAGGPIVQPDMEMMITTPICPHILYSRSFITSPDRKLRITINDDYPDSAIITMDGQEGFRIAAGDEILITRAQKKIKLVSFNDINFFDVLRAKIHQPSLKLNT
ncbi:MAG: NAD(+)/NADH kinase [Clostridiaceae bacterium]|nr:NAD(+)/NADH kinase [Clostridiaceae bacterium]